MTLHAWETGPMRPVKDVIGFCYAFPVFPSRYKLRVAIYELSCGHVVEAAQERARVACERCGEEIRRGSKEAAE